MKIRDEADWQRQLADFANDPHPAATSLQNFLVTWANYAEGVLATVRLPEITSPMEALRQTLVTTEQHTGRTSIGFIGAALTLLSMHWGYGETLYDDMNPIERHLIEDATLVKLETLAAQAAQEGHL
jgi:hypothetical protein